MENWQTFYFLCGSSAASLTGLMFIAVTFGSKIVTEKNLEEVNTFLSPIAFHFVQVFFLACVASVPTVHSQFLGVMVFLSAVWRLVELPHAYRVVKRAAENKRDVDVTDWMTGVWAPALIFLMLLGCGVAFFYDDVIARDLLATSMIALLMLGVRAAWELLVWMATKVTT